MATVSQDGTVTRKMYGDVTVYAVPTDGSGVYGECTIHFLKNTATSIFLLLFKTEKGPEPGKLRSLLLFLRITPV